MNIIKASQSQWEAISSLLQKEKLPVGDISKDLDHFFVAVDNGNVVGVIGLEQYEDCGLLRSMVVHSSYRNKNIASSLVTVLEKYAAGLNISCMYLLTETADEYFKRKGYLQISREQAPAVIQQSSEFRSTCPSSAIVMKKHLNKN